MIQNLDSKSDAVNIQKITSDLLKKDTDKNQKISKKELEDYIGELESNKQQVPEFLQKLQEKFTELDKDKDLSLSSAEMGSLQYNRGLWTINPISDTSTATATTAANSSNGNSIVSAASSLMKNPLVKEGVQNLARQAYNQIKDKVNVQDIIGKIS